MRNRYVLLADLALIAISAFGAFALRFDWLFVQHRPEFLGFLAAVLIIKPVVMFGFGMYGRYWRYATAQDLVGVVLATSAASVATALYVGFGRTLGFVGDFSRPVLLIDWLLMLLTAGGLRMSVRVIGDARRTARKGDRAGRRIRVIVIGAGDAGAMVVREMRRNPQLRQEPIGFLDDDPVKRGKTISGVRVFGSLDRLSEILTEKAADEVVIAMPAAPGAVVRRLVDECRRAGVVSRIVPGVFELLGGQISVSRLRTVEITDLLRRAHLAQADWTAEYVRGGTVLITGAGGSIGRELARQVAHAAPQRLLLLGHGENSIFDTENMIRRDFPAANVRSIIADIRDPIRIASVFSEHVPQVIFHAAAHKHLPLMEENPIEAVSNNILGTYIVASAAARCRAQRFVLISTDKAVAPTSIMGATKRVAEMVVRRVASNASTTFVVVRFGNVLGSRGSVVPIFKSQIEAGGPITLTHPDVRRFFMTIPEAVNLVLRAGGFEGGSASYVLDMGTPIRIQDLAEDLIRLSGYSVEEIPIVFTGLRPAEKLEELLWEEPGYVETTSQTGILKVGGERDQLSGSLDDVVATFRDLARTGTRLDIEAALASQVATFVPRTFAPRLGASSSTAAL